MLTRWSLENFKPIRGRIDMKLAPLTVLAGLNSSGKSSFLQSILMIAQTLANQKMDSPLILNGIHLQLGTFADVLNERAGTRELRIGFTIAVDSGDPSVIDTDLRFEAADTSKDGATGVDASRVLLSEATLGFNDSRRLLIGPLRDEDFGKAVPPRLRKELPRLAHWESGAVALVSLNHFVPWIISEKSNDGNVYVTSFDHAKPIFAAFVESLRYVGPLRAEPNAVQSFSPTGQPDDVGPRGEYAASVFATNREAVIRYWNPLSSQVEDATLEQAMDLWLRYLGVADHVSTREAAVPGVSWMVRSTPKTADRPLHAVGVGVSQLLPILVSGLLSATGTILIIEQPELHLHERPQARLGDFFYGLTQLGKQVLVETHSAVLISQLRYRMVKDGQTARDAIAIYFVEQDENGDTQARPIQISPRGAIENWPDGFFDESFRQEDRITQEGILARGNRKNA